MYVPCFARKNGTRFLNVVEERDDVIELLPNELIDRLRARPEISMPTCRPRIRRVVVHRGRVVNERGGFGACWARAAGFQAFSYSTDSSISTVSPQNSHV